MTDIVTLLSFFTSEKQSILNNTSTEMDAGFPVELFSVITKTAKLLRYGH